MIIVILEAKCKSLRSQLLKVIDGEYLAWYVLEDEGELYLAVWLDSGHVGWMYSTQLNPREKEGWLHNGIDSLGELKGALREDFMRGAQKRKILNLREVDSKLQHKIDGEIVKWNKEKGHDKN